MGRPNIERFLYGQSSGPRWAILRLALVPFALTYGAIMGLRRFLHARGWLRRDRLSVPVVSVGNLTMGGTGKTPFVRMLAQRLIDDGHRPLIIGRGYGAAAGGGLDEEGASLQSELDGALVVQSPDRFPRGRSELPGDPPFTVTLLDDGAQCLRYHRDVNIVLLDAERPFAAGWPLPAGALREFPGAVRSAHLVVMTRSEALTPEDRHRVSDRVRATGYTGPMTWARHEPHRIWGPDGSIHTLEGRRVFLISGIARPDSFARSATSLGAEVVGERVFRDHHRFSDEDVLTTDAEARGLGADILLATGKDAPKLSVLARPSLPLCFLEVTVRLDPEGERLLAATLERAGIPLTSVRSLCEAPSDDVNSSTEGT